MELLMRQGERKIMQLPELLPARVLIDESNEELFVSFTNKIQNSFRKEYTGTDEGITVTVTKRETGSYPVLNAVSREKTVFFLMQLPYGVQKMSGVIDGLAETSCNLGIFELPLEENYLFACISVRSSVGSAKVAFYDKICYLTEFLGGEYETSGDYPAWEYREDSPLRENMKVIYEEMYGSSPRVEAIHAGLECGLFYDRIPGLD